MAATLVSQLEAAVAAVQREAAAHGGSLGDDSETVSDFCLLLERVMNFATKKNTTVLGDKKDYWAYLLAALEKSSVQPMLRRIQGAPDNKTTLGKARSFIRACLVGKCLGSVLQEALQKKKTTDQYFHHESIFRLEPLALRLVDAGYHLSEITFTLDERLCVDDGWPTFQAKDFSEVAAQRADDFFVGTPAEQVLPPHSFIHTMGESSDAGSVPVDPALSTELERLRAEKALILKERDDALKDKHESDVVWTATVSSLKDKAVALREKLATAEQQLGAERDRSTQLEAQLARSHEQLEAAQARIAELEPKPEEPAAPTEEVQKETPPSVESIEQRVAAEVEAKFQVLLDEANARAHTAEEKLRLVVDEYEETKTNLLAQISTLEQQLKAEQSNSSLLQEQHTQDEAAMVHMREVHAKAIQEMKQMHNESMKAQADHADGLRQQLSSAATEKTGLVAEIHALKVQLGAEAERTVNAEKNAVQLHNALLKATEDKFKFWSKADELGELAEQIATTANSTWEDDDAVNHCNQCGSEFSLLKRKHHCRMCGKIFCGTCSSNMVQLSSSRKPERTCTPCYILLPRMKAKNRKPSDVDEEGSVGSPRSSVP